MRPARKTPAQAWLGGGTLALGGGGMAAGEALLTMAGPVGWAIAGSALLFSGVLFFKRRGDKKRLDLIFVLIGERDVKSYKLAIVELEERIRRIRSEAHIFGEFVAHLYGKDRIRHYRKCEKLIIMLANLLYKVHLNEADRMLLWQALRRNEDVLRAAGTTADEFDIAIVNAAIRALKNKYGKLS